MIKPSATGPQGCGKTVLLRLIGEFLKSRGVAHKYFNEDKSGPDYIAVQDMTPLSVKPIMWLVEKAGHVPFTTRNPVVAEHAELHKGCTVTPIYSALQP